MFTRKLKQTSFFRDPAVTQAVNLQQLTADAHTRIGSVVERFAMGKLALGPVFLPVLTFFLVYIILSILVIHLHLLGGQAGGRIVETFQLSNPLSYVGNLESSGS
jgi:hypothetical protein